MSHSEDHASRRHFIKLAAGTAAVALVGSGWRSARAADLPHLAAGDPTAKALGYVEDVAKLSDPKRATGAVCANCQFYVGAAAGYGPCQLFPGKAVSAKGWCISHSPKAK